MAKGIKQLYGYPLIDQTARNDIKNNYQKKTDENLQTTDKTIVGGINEVAAQCKDIAKKYNYCFNDIKHIAHRGYSTEAPENTIPAYKLASEYGYWGGECDVWETHDGEFILMHDDTIDRTTNGTGKISELTLAEIKKFNIDFGENIDKYPNLKVPTLEEYLLACKQCELIPVIEVKSINNIDKFLSIIENTIGTKSCIIISFNKDLLINIRNKNNIINLQCVSNEFTTDLVLECVNNRMDIDVFHGSLTKELVQLAHSKGVLVNTWTVTIQEHLNKYIDYPIDMVTTDNIIDTNNCKPKIKEIEKKLADSTEFNQIKNIEIGNQNGINNTYDEVFSHHSTTRAFCRNKFILPIGETKVNLTIPNDYKCTFLPFNKDGVFFKDIGWLSNGEIVLPDNTVYFCIYWSKADGTDFTKYELDVLRSTVVNIKKKVDNYPTTLLKSFYMRGFAGVNHTFDETYIGESTNRCYCSDKFVFTAAQSKVVNITVPDGFRYTLHPYNNSGILFKDLGWLNNGNVTLPDETVYFIFYFSKTDDSSFDENSFDLLRTTTITFN